MKSNFSFKTNSLLILICLFSSFSFSQIIYSNKESSRFSFTVGMTSSNLLKDSIHYKPGILFNGGFMYGISLSDRFNLTANVLYTGKSFKNDAPIIKYRFFYVDAPLYLQYKLGDNIRINLGGQYSWATNSKILVIDGTSSTGTNIKNGSAIKATDYGFLFGAEIDFNESISMAARYTISGSTFFEKDKVNFGVFQFSFNYVVYNSHKNLFHKNKEAKG
jgi:hypothetical protein